MSKLQQQDSVKKPLVEGILWFYNSCLPENIQSVARFLKLKKKLNYTRYFLYILLKSFLWKIRGVLLLLFKNCTHSE